MNMEPLKLYSSRALFGIGPHSGSVYPHSGCEMRGGEVWALVNMEPLKLYSSRALFGIDPDSGSVYPHSGCLCDEGMQGGTPDNRGVLTVVFQ